MAKRKLPYMKFWVGDWLSSQKVMELSTIEEYCYFRLILWSWQAKGLGLESKDETLAEYCRLPLDVWIQCREKVLSLFEERSGRLYHHKVEEQMQTQIELSETRAEAGRQGGRGHKKAIASPTVKQTVSNPLMALDSSFDSGTIDVRQESKKLRDFYLEEVSSSDQTRTQALGFIDMVLMEETHSPDKLQLAISRYAQEFKVSGSGMALSCKKFFSERLYVEFLRDDWTEPKADEGDADKFKRLLKDRLGGEGA